jgi:hypothetical protein
MTARSRRTKRAIGGFTCVDLPFVLLVVSSLNPGGVHFGR